MQCVDIADARDRESVRLALLQTHKDLKACIKHLETLAHDLADRLIPFSAISLFKPLHRIEIIKTFDPHRGPVVVIQV